MKKKFLVAASLSVFSALTLGSQIVYAAKNVPDYSSYTLNISTATISNRYNAFRNVPGHWVAKGDSGWRMTSQNGNIANYRIDYYWGAP